MTRLQIRSLCDSRLPQLDAIIRAQRGILRFEQPLEGIRHKINPSDAFVNQDEFDAF